VATLERAIEIAVLAHKGVSDKAGAPYVLHPLRLMFAVDSPTAKIVAVLHDVVEDSKPPNRYGFDELRAEGFSEPVLTALDCVTAREGESYDAFIQRILPNPIARSVKIADVTDNLDVRRLGTDLTDRDVERIKKYRRALSQLKGD
jgi:hypothetical protein